MNEQIKVLIVEPNREPYSIEIDNTLKATQKIVNGYIELVPLKYAELVCNEEGKYTEMKNRDLFKDDYDSSMPHEYWDTVCGTFLILESDPETGEFKSLSPENIEYYKERFSGRTIMHSQLNLSKPPKSLTIEEMVKNIKKRTVEDPKREKKELER